MSSILRLSSVNILNCTITSIRAPAIGILMCNECFKRRFTAPPERRSYSTNESLLTILQKKKAKLKKEKKYTELLKVSKNKATHKKIFFGKLNPSHVEAFAEQPGLVLGSLNKSVENSKNQKLKSNVESDAMDVSVGKDEKVFSEEFGNKNDCDKFGTLSNSYSNQFSKKSFEKREAYKEENDCDKFGTLTNVVKAEEKMSVRPVKHTADSSAKLLGENPDESGIPSDLRNNTETFSMNSVKKIKLRSSEKLSTTENERMVNKESRSDDSGILNKNNSEFPSVSSMGLEPSLESQKFVPEIENLVTDYLNKKGNLKTSVEEILSADNDAKEAMPYSELPKDRKNEKDEFDAKFFESGADKKTLANPNIKEGNEIKPFTARKADFFQKTLNKSSYTSLPKLKIDEIFKKKENDLVDSNNQIKSKGKEASDYASEILKGSNKLNRSNKFLNNPPNRNSNLAKKIEINPLDSKKQKPNFFENDYNKAKTWDYDLESVKISNKLAHLNEFNKEGHLPNQNKEILKSKTKSKLTTERKEDNARLLQKENAYNEFLVSYIDVCIHSGMIEKAHYKLMRERRLNLKHHNLKIKDIEVYNTLLHGYSRQGNWGKVEEILRILKEDGFAYNEQTYAAVFDCLGNIRNEFNTDFVKYISNKYIEELKAQGLDIGDVFNKTQLVNNQREKILSIIRVNCPNYEIPKMEYEKNNSCELLHRLNEITETYKTQAPEEITHDMLKEFIEEQITYESGTIFKIKAIHKPSFDYNEKTEQLFNDWKPLLRDAFIKSVKILKYDNENNRQKSNLYVYLNSLPVDTFVDCMLYEIKRTVSEFMDPPTYIATAILGSRVWQRYVFQKKEKTGELEKLIKLYKIYAEWYLNPHGPAINGRQYWQSLLENHAEGPHIEVKPKRWPYKVLRDVGHFLYEIIIKEVKIDINFIKVGKFESRLVPVFYTQLEEDKKKKEEIIKFHPVMQKIFQACNASTLTFDVDQIPMVSPPKPWCHVNSGGYLLQKTVYTRSVGGVSASPLQYDKIPQTQLYPTFDSLNQLQTIPWRINAEVLDIAVKVFKNGGSEELNVPALPDMKPVKIKIDKEMSEEKIRHMVKERKKATLEKINDYGLWCEALYKLSLANHFRNKIIWLPQNMDFRGRVYPVPPHITHLGADLYRSLFLFAKGKELGPTGLDWLKIHTINLTGSHKRKSVKERLEYANEILPEILDSAKKPLDGNKWWVKSDEQWQTLAACMEIKKALEYPDPEKYVCRFPIHQDGSCNGLQHYAALGRDFIGAQSVNLSPSETPQDVYSVVVGIVERKRKEDEAVGLPIAKVLNGFISRKVIKQTIMTTVYGVTHYGAKLQIQRQLEDLKEFPQEYKQWAATYLSQKTFESLNEMFTSAREIQEWFVNCAGIISSIKHDYVRWVTPLGLPVEQPYAKIITPKGKEKDQKVLLPNTLKQKNAFPPNFIHSLDSSHMMLTSLYCEQAGITFASIHDCFWTHPSTVEVMNKACREQFIALHSQPILQNLSEYFCETYKNLPEDKMKVLGNIPPRGDFDINSIMESIYFFS